MAPEDHRPVAGPAEPGTYRYQLPVDPPVAPCRVPSRQSQDDRYPLRVVPLMATTPRPSRLRVQPCRRL